MVEFPTIETDRMVLRPLTLEDSQQVFGHFSDPIVAEFMDIEPCKDIDEAKKIIQFHIDDTGCRWGAFDKVTHQLVGTLGYHCWNEGTQSTAEIGFDLGKTYWGQGYMSEALHPVIQFGFGNMGLALIEATVEPENHRSIRLLKKLGFIQARQLEDGLVLFTLKTANKIDS